jgi:uncharacterized protein YwgA
MDMQQIRLGLVLRETGVPLNVRQFSERLILQKSGYLLQQAGVSLGYHFSWYLRGPYSPDYTDDVFALAGATPEDRAELNEWKLDEGSHAVAERIKGLFESAWKHARPDRWLELLASALFLLRTRQVSAHDAAGIVQVLEKNDKHYSEHEVVEGLEELRRYGFGV